VKKLFYVERKINKCSTVISLLPMVSHEEYFRVVWLSHCANKAVMGHCYGSRTRLLYFLYWSKTNSNNMEEREVFNHGKTKKHHVYLYLEI
jgi:hypothetical protein